VSDDTIHPEGHNVLVVGDRRWPAEIYIETVDHGDLIGVDSNARWFHRRMARVLFESGWGVSVLWGSGSYSSNHHRWTETINETPTRVECGVLGMGGGLTDGRVAGYLPAGYVNALLDAVSKWPSRGAISLPALIEEMFS